MKEAMRITACCAVLAFSGAAHADTLGEQVKARELAAQAVASTTRIVLEDPKPQEKLVTVQWGEGMLPTPRRTARLRLGLPDGARASFRIGAPRPFGMGAFAAEVAIPTSAATFNLGGMTDGSTRWSLAFGVGKRF